MAKSGKDKFRIKSEKLPEFISKLEDLTKISDSIKIKIESENTMMYSILGKATVLAFKNYNIPTSELFEMKDDFEYGIDIIILNAKKFVKNLNFLKESEKVTIEITHKESQDDDGIMDTRAMQIVGGRLKVNWIGGEHYEIKDMNKKKLDQGLHLKNSRWSFNITKSEIEDKISILVNSSIKLLNNKKTCDLKASYGDLFKEYLTEYDYVGCYDIDTLMGDLYNWVHPYLGKYDFISTADPSFHNRLSGPFLIWKNKQDLNTIYKKLNFIDVINLPEVYCFEEKEFSNFIIDFCHLTNNTLGIFTTLTSFNFNFHNNIYLYP
jgi:hypothetical protein